MNRDQSQVRARGLSDEAVVFFPRYARILDRIFDLRQGSSRLDESAWCSATQAAAQRERRVGDGGGKLDAESRREITESALSGRQTRAGMARHPDDVVA